MPTLSMSIPFADTNLQLKSNLYGGMILFVSTLTFEHFFHEWVVEHGNDQPICIHTLSTKKFTFIFFILSLTLGCFVKGSHLNIMVASRKVNLAWGYVHEELTIFRKSFYQLNIISFTLRTSYIWFR